MQLVDKAGAAAYVLRQLYQKHLQDFEAAVRSGGNIGKQQGQRSGHSIADASIELLDPEAASVAELLAVLKEDGETAVFDLPIADSLAEPPTQSVRINTASGIPGTLFGLLGSSSLRPSGWDVRHCGPSRQEAVSAIRTHRCAAVLLVVPYVCKVLKLLAALTGLDQGGALTRVAVSRADQHSHPELRALPRRPPRG